MLGPLWLEEEVSLYDLVLEESRGAVFSHVFWANLVVVLAVGGFGLGLSLGLVGLVVPSVIVLVFASVFHLSVMMWFLRRWVL